VPAGVVVRDSRDDDLPAIEAIYAYHVSHGLASFEEVPPSLAELRRRREEILAKGLPYIVAAEAAAEGGGAGGAVLGYAYASAYRTRTAYRYTLEDSVYVRPGLAGRGIGRALLAALIDRCAAAGYRQMVAVIGDSANAASIGLHAALGFREVGVLRSIGFKLGRWVDSVLMQRPLGPGDATLPE
jgi:phosphinothricin acetyltransferase